MRDMHDKKKAHNKEQMESKVTTVLKYETQHSTHTRPLEQKEGNISTAAHWHQSHSK